MGLISSLRRCLRGALLLGLSLSCTSCFFFYDSRWGEAKASQKRVAAKRMPSQLRAETDVGGLAGDGVDQVVQKLRLRAFATPRYASALVDGRAQFEQALGDANPTLVHDLAFRLELTSYEVWRSATNDDDLAELLARIAQEVPASDDDWIVVLASPREMVATSADQLGVAPMLGRHFVLRAMSDAAEFDVIERGFDELSQDEKRKLYGARKRHKSATVLLHEIGHTLGIPHELDARSLMSPTYNTEAASFSTQAARLGRRGLELRATALGTALHRDSAQAALNLLRTAPEHTWEGGSAQKVERLFESHARVAQASATATLPSNLAPKTEAAPRTATKGSPPTLTPTDSAIFARAKAAEAAGQIAEARTIAAPLFETYTKLYAVQELRCQLAMKAGLPMDAERAECDPLLKLSGGGL